MATIVPSNAAVDALWRSGNFTRLRQLEADDDRRRREDYRTVSTERGPVRGYER